MVLDERTLSKPSTSKVTIRTFIIVGYVLKVTVESTGSSIAGGCTTVVSEL